MLLVQVDADVVEKVPAIIEAAAKSTLGIVALFVLVLGLLAYALFKASSERAKLAVFGGLLVGAGLFGFAAFTVAPDVLVSRDTPRSNGVTATSTVVEAMIWRVDGDWKGEVVGANRFVAASSTLEAQDSLAQAVVSWIRQELKIPAAQEAPPTVQLMVNVPASLRDGVAVTTRPEVPFSVSTWDTKASSKSRLPITGQDLSSRTQPFVLEIDIPGYATHTIEVTPGTPLTDTIAIAGGQRTHSVGIEAFGGNIEFGATLTRALLQAAGINVVSPESLEARREVLRREAAELAANPMVQTTVRGSLGVSYIIGGVGRRE